MDYFSCSICNRMVDTFCLERDFKNSYSMPPREFIVDRDWKQMGTQHSKHIPVFINHMNYTVFIRIIEKSNNHALPPSMEEFFLEPHQSFTWKPYSDLHSILLITNFSYPISIKTGNDKHWYRIPVDRESPQFTHHYGHGLSTVCKFEFGSDNQTCDDTHTLSGLYPVHVGKYHVLLYHVFTRWIPSIMELYHAPPLLLDSAPLSHNAALTTYSTRNSITIYMIHGEDSYFAEHMVWLSCIYENGTRSYQPWFVITKYTGVRVFSCPKKETIPFRVFIRAKAKFKIYAPFCKSGHCKENATTLSIEHSGFNKLYCLMNCRRVKPDDPWYNKPHQWMGNDAEGMAGLYDSIGIEFVRPSAQDPFF